MLVKELLKVLMLVEYGKVLIIKFVFLIGLSLFGGIFEGVICIFIILR